MDVALNFPTLPQDHKWLIDRHNNLFAGPVAALKIVRTKQHEVLGIKFTTKKTLAYSVTFDENKWINDEAKYMATLV